ncbi:hypothetical protein CC85DRAFT_281423 [Cutaneotrichosporon oleaginosum]|uniref:C3H1-type domain-containing protein n=1 Tax=Cutaneotrichosporon oleaginosum TaxID=879819 RepID=A0A0J0XZ44_9TREE|nr:uncharacterized protein CC85DRAFT_281423 [Cutaneotrichosporon oleaginosum]KLT46335.1 hypothetical protein CC85DRAFT_281423 [Cutaneotrichosporon oleaginosum]TXT15293.1 hypothetical protein COLE_01486 [Cutaneotrichosporon oleaginosum]
MPDASVLETNPHLAHYVFKLVQTNAALQPRAQPTAGGQHPLSVSSSGESDEEDDAANDDAHNDAASADESKLSTSSGSGSSAIANGRPPVVPTREEREELVRKIITLLDNEEEEDIKDLLREPMGELGKDEILMDQVCLDCMHRHRDDVSGVPYQPGSFTPTRTRRPFTPPGVGALRARTPLARPHSPVTLGSGASTPTYGAGPSALGRVDSASSAVPAPPAPASSSGYSSSGSPVSSPRVLNVKAAAFNPSTSPTAPQPSARNVPSLNIMASNANFAPSDNPWRDAVPDPLPRSGSPFTIGSQGMVRTGSNRAIAAPLISDPSSPFHSPLGTPTRPQMRLRDSDYSSPTAVRPASRGVVPDEADDEEFSPFGSSLPKLHQPEPSGLSAQARAFDGFAAEGTDVDEEDDPTNASNGMTPLDVLAQVFSTVPRHQLETALHNAGYDFEAAMAMLVAQFTLPRSGASTPNRVASPRPLIGIDGRGVNHGLAPNQGYFNQGGRNFQGPTTGFGGPRTVGPTRMCRYFLNGECRRSDCRFSHDLDRALCRFWLRGHCAKGPNCEFMHNLPPTMDPSTLNAAMQRLDINSPGGSRPGTPPVHGSYGAGDDFPDLLAARLNRHVGRFDPTRNRFANAVKRPMPAAPVPTVMATGSRMTTASGGVGFAGGSGSFSPAPGAGAPTPAALAQPRPSNRVKLHPPTLLPTLQTGQVANEQYMSARAASLRLGHARNACLARAADAFRRGDGAAAKRFSREGKALNEKMLSESHEAANVLVKERMKDAQKAVLERDPSWSDDPRDRAERGRECGGGFGVVLGVASAGKVPEGRKLSSEERTECLLDLHTLHGNEGADIVSHFLAELERENYRGLAYVVVGEEKHVGQQDPARGASKVRLAASVKSFLGEWGYAWSESGGVLCIDPCR